MEKFLCQPYGYDTFQVDDYINMIKKSYLRTYKEYQAMCSKYNALLKDYKRLESEKYTGKKPDMDEKAADAKSFIDADIFELKFKNNMNSNNSRKVSENYLERTRMPEQDF